jgi:protein O-GlcNAc transferase
VTIPQAFDLALNRHHAGRLADAEALYSQILAVQPGHAGALHHLGVIALQAGRHELAIERIRKAILLDPNNPTAHSNLGLACSRIGRLDEAIATFHRALALKPNSPETLSNLGVALRARGQLDEAIATYGHALELKPDYPEAWNNLGNALAGRGRCDEAINAYRRAIELRPGYPEAHNNLGAELAGQGQLEAAIAEHRYALQLNPDYPEAWNNLGAALARRGQLDEAVSAYRRAIQIEPAFQDAHNNLGDALKDKGELGESIAAFRRALKLKPEDTGCHSNLIYTLNFLPDFDDRKIAEEQQRWNRQINEPLKHSYRPHANDRTPDRRLRIGYVSPDFRDHVVGKNLLPLFERHDPRNLEIFCYSGVTRPDRVTDAFRRCAQKWRNTVGVADEALADMIRGDGVDILVDLAQHMAGNRLPVFARKPAPVQVSFAGYPASTGLEAIEFRISDPYLEGVSAGKESLRKEQVYFIDSFWCYDAFGLDLAVNSLPASESGTVTFGCLNTFCKINGSVLSLWARVLGKIKDSRLFLRSPAGDHRQRTLEALEREGVAARRVEFVDTRPQREYLKLYRRMDIILDTFPYNGHTTSLDALWMGVPVVSLAGDTPVSRAGLSQLSNLGLTELVAHSEPEFLNIAESLAMNLPRLAQLRSILRDRMKTSVLMDATRFTQQVDEAYRQMWQAWCNKESHTRMI